MIDANKKHIAVLASLFSMLAMAMFSKNVIDAAKSALALCAGKIVPSIFPFMVASAVLVSNTQSDTFKFAKGTVRFLFGTSSLSPAAIIPGIVCGYPSGAICTCALYSDGLISKSEAESLIAFSNNSGPLFIIGAVGTGMLGSAKIGAQLYVIHIFSAIVCGIALKAFTKPLRTADTKSSAAKGGSFTDAVCQSVSTVLKVCGFVVIFAVILKIVEPLFSLFNPYVSCIASAFLEMTNGVCAAAELDVPMRIKLTAISAALSWAGLSVHMQIKSITSPVGLSLKKYYLTRPLACGVSAYTAYMTFKTPGSHFTLTVNPEKTVFKILTSLSIIIAAAVIKQNIKNKHTAV